MYLAIYDLSGMQRYIFSTGKLREQVGASKLIHDILYVHLPAILGEEPFRWEEDKELYNFDIKRHHIVYIGGGNALVLYKNKEYMQECTRNLEKEVVKLTGNKLRLCSAWVEVKEETPVYYDVYTELMKEMANNKYLSSPIRLVSGFAIGEHDPITLEPITLIKKDEEIKDSKLEYGAASRIQKERQYQKIICEKICQNEEDSGREKRKYATKFESFRSDDRKSFVAVIHIDGDTMGQQIQDVSRKLKKENKSFEDSMLEMRTISKSIDFMYQQSLEATIEKLYPIDDPEKEVPIRPLISDGDDITVLIEAGKAFDFVETFMSELKKSKEKFEKIKEHKFKVSASAGIVFVHDKFPFYVAYEIAEELCKFAKAVKRDCENKESTMDFHIVQSGMRSNLEEYREKNYMKKSGYQLHIRPYFFKEESSDINSYNRFKEVRKFLKEGIESELIARSKLKKLRDSYAESVSEAERHYQFMLQRSEGKELEKIAKSAFEICEEDNKGENEESCHKRAYFFDALEVMDF